MYPILTSGWHPPPLIPEKVDTDARIHVSHERMKTPRKGSLKQPITKIHIGIDHFAVKHGQIEEENLNLCH
jgi:hypothetical protein